jgi:hypothetical protein
MIERKVGQVLVAMLLVATSAGTLLVAGPRSDGPESRERTRIRAHLARVENELRRRDVSGWPAEARTARARHLDRLHGYWNHGCFPHNHDFPECRVPQFVDRHGTRCAVAWLIECSGRRDLVERIASTRNDARIRDLAADPDLRGWLASAGLTLAEAALIQPSYDFDRQPEESSHAVLVGTLAFTDAVEVWIIAANARLDDPWNARRTRGTLGFLGGLAGTTLGAYSLNAKTGATGGLGVLTMMVSAIATVASIRNLNTHFAGEDSPSASTTAVRPEFFVRSRSNESPQLAVRLRF